MSRGRSKANQLQSLASSKRAKRSKCKDCVRGRLQCDGKLEKRLARAKKSNTVRRRVSSKPGHATSKPQTTAVTPSTHNTVAKQDNPLPIFDHFAFTQSNPIPVFSKHTPTESISHPCRPSSAFYCAFPCAAAAEAFAWTRTTRGATGTPSTMPRTTACPCPWH